MTDKELLELAAKAAGYIPVGESEDGLFLVSQAGKGSYRGWDPLDSDAQALRVAVKLKIAIEIYEDSIHAISLEHDGCHSFTANPDDLKDPYAATRRAIVRAAALS